MEHNQKYKEAEPFGERIQLHMGGKLELLCKRINITPLFHVDVDGVPHISGKKSMNRAKDAIPFR
jgi:hypothetical protein